MTAYDFGIQKFEPTRMTPLSNTCLVYIVSRERIATTTLRTAISNHFTVLGYIALKTERYVLSESKIKIRDLRTIKGEKALNFLFVLDQN